MKHLIKLLSLCLILGSNSISAAIVTFNFQAEIIGMGVFSPSIPPGFVQSGDIIKGSFSYDTSAILSGPTTTNYYSQLFDTDIYGVEMTVGSVTALKEDGFNYRVGITTDMQNSIYEGAHSLAISSFTFSDGWPGGSGATFSFSLIDTTGTTFSGNTLPDNLSLADFDIRSLVITDWNGGAPEWNIGAEITQLSIAAVPVPASLILFLSGLGFLFTFQKSNHAHNQSLNQIGAKDAPPG